MGVYIKGFKPQDGLYQIKDGVIRKYKGKGGTVRPYELVEVKEPRCYLDGFMRRRTMGIDEAILIMENERPHCGDKLTFTEEERYEAYTWAIGALKELSSAQPGTARRIVGKSRDGITLWYQCDMCNEPVDAQDNFCSGCGRRLTDE